MISRCAPSSSECNTGSPLEAVNGQSLTHYKKLSYCRDSVRQQSLHCWRSFEVTDVSTNRKPVCDFLLVNTTNSHLILHRLPVFAQYCQIIAFDEGVPLVNAHVLSNLCEYRHKSYIVKNQILWTTFLSQTVWVYLQPLWGRVGTGLSGSRVTGSTFWARSGQVTGQSPEDMTQSFDPDLI